MVAYPDRTAFFGDYFRVGGDTPETLILDRRESILILPKSRWTQAGLGKELR
jgi:hypothetical protein